MSTPEAKKGLGGEIANFVGVRHRYYTREFGRIQRARKPIVSWNGSALAFGPLWGVYRQMWGFFWGFLTLELFALVLMARGLLMEAGGDKRIRYEKLSANIAKRQEQLQEMVAGGDQAGAEVAAQIIANLQRAAGQLQGQLAEESLGEVLLAGVFLFVLIKLVEGLYANLAYEKRYRRWRVRPRVYKRGVSRQNVIAGGLLAMAIYPMTIFRFSVHGPDQVLSSWVGSKFTITRFPLGRELFAPLAKWGDQGFDWIALRFGGLFDGVRQGIAALVNALEVLLIETPWPVAMVIFVAMALRFAGPRTAIFTAASLAYLALMGLWELSMITVALIGAATFLCLLLGIPLGVWLGRQPRAHAFVQPLLDFMQTMPAFVYLIPVIAFFGTGKPPGVLATIVFAMPPVIRLTALGIRNVPEPIKEAALAFGCTRWQLLRHVEFPLAMPSIMTGINQTILMGLSMVVVASLIGAEGLGVLILESLQYAAKGQGLLGGLAILLCAMVIDRIVQGAFKNSGK